MAETRQANQAAAQARRAAQRAAEIKARRRRAILALVGGTVVSVAVVAGLLFWYNYTHPGESYPEMSDRHHLATATEQHVPYSTDPPTSGPHYAGSATDPQHLPWGVVATQVPNEIAVHNLEDAGVLVLYRPDLPAADVARLQAIVQSYDDKHMDMHQIDGTTKDITGHVLMMPYATLKEPIVLTAWTRMQRFQIVDETAIRHFIDMYRGIDHHVAQG
ncbi:MAG TPA: DUF3105 domain-containing protein [Chloroflexia bacterium]|nr:DUF3105 domain-containing protein [Chloroflexia bacterium]